MNKKFLVISLIIGFIATLLVLSVASCFVYDSFEPFIQFNDYHTNYGQGCFARADYRSTNCYEICVDTEQCRSFQREVTLMSVFMTIIFTVCSYILIDTLYG